MPAKTAALYQVIEQPDLCCFTIYGSELLILPYTISHMLCCDCHVRMAQLADVLHSDSKQHSYYRGVGDWGMQ